GRARARAARGAGAALAAPGGGGTAARGADAGRGAPGAGIVLQRDDRALPAVIAGEVPTASGLNRLPAPEPADLEAGLRSTISAVPTFTVVHCCAVSVPFGMIIGAGANAAGCDLSKLGRAGEGGRAQAVEAGLGILAGVIPATGTAAAPEPPPASQAAQAVTGLWQRLGWPVARNGGPAGPGSVTAQVVLAPACGMAGATPGYARAAMA